MKIRTIVAGLAGNESRRDVALRGLLILLVATLLCMMMIGAGCRQQEQEAPTPQVPDATTQPGDGAAMPSDPNDTDGGDVLEPRQPREPQEVLGHQFEVEIIVLESSPEQYRVSAQVVARSGGYELHEDRVDRDGEVVRMYLTFIAPAPDEIVTMVLVDHHVVHDAGTAVTRRAEVYVRGVVRGAEVEGAPYVLAARTP